jgi:hypothetical protein
VIAVANISDLNKREREAVKVLNDIEKKLRDKKISKIDYSKVKTEKNKELERIKLERESVVASLPSIPAPPKPPRSSALSSFSDDIKNLQVGLKKSEKDMLFTQSEMGKLFSEVVKNRERIKNMESALRGMGSKPVAGIGVKMVDDRIAAQIERMKSAMGEGGTKSREEIDRMSGTINELRREVEELKKIKNAINASDLSGLRRDIESLKEKSEWIEKQVENVDIEPLYELVKELEDRMSSRRVTSPVIIE